jgi:adhesin/invasin
MNFNLKLLSAVAIFSIISNTVFAGWDTAKRRTLNKLESAINKNLDNTEVTITSQERNKPKFEILTVQPLAEQENSITFFQGSAIRSDGDRETVNLGLGHRIFLNDDLTMLGINGFYDHELDYDHKRTSIGAELRTSAYEFNTNSYFAGSNSRTGKNNIAEESLDGFDFEVGGHLPYIPNWKVFTKHFDFEVPGGNDFEGLEYSTEIYVPGKGFKLVAGHKDYDNHHDHWFFEISFNLGAVNSNSKFVRDTAYSLTSMKDKKLDKVRRENLIIKKKGSGFTVTASGF